MFTKTEEENMVFFHIHCEFMMNVMTLLNFE